MANRIFLRTVLLSLGLVFASCGSNSFDTKKELWTYLKSEKNGYHFKKVVKGIEYTLTYKPTDLLVQQELGEKYNLEQIENLREKYGQYLYFNLSMSANGQEILNQKVGNRAAFGTMVNQLAFGMGEKVNLISQARDTIPLVDYVYPRMYGMSQSTDMLLVYECDQNYLNHEYIKFTLEDFGLGTGEIAFKLDTEKIRNQPKLLFK